MSLHAEPHTEIVLTTPDVDIDTHVAHAALSIPELLENIFVYAPKRANTVNVCVCKHWSEVGKRVLWRNVEDVADLVRLFKLLSPLIYVGDGTKNKKLSRLPDMNDWARFYKYSSLIRVIRFTDTPRYRTAFSMIAEMRPFLNLFPNLHTLECSGHQDLAPVQRCILFMHPTVKRFTIKLPRYRSVQPPTAVVQFISEICRMPFLVYLDIQTPDIDLTPLLGVIQSSQCLETIVLPNYHTTAAVINSLALHPRLVHLRANRSGRTTERGRNIPFVPSLREDAFPNIQTLTFSTSAASATKFLTHQFFPTNLRALHIETTTPEYRSSLQSLFETVAERCEMLEEFTLYELDYLLTDELCFNYPSLKISIDSLKPLFLLPKLTTLKLKLKLIVDLNVLDIEDLARSLPLIENLFLNEEPIDDDSDSDVLLPWSVLPIFARNCLGLKRLGVAIDACERHTVDLSTLRPFHSLEALHLGISQILSQYVDHVAVFLAHMLPAKCELVQPVWDVEEWKKVIEMLPSLITLREYGMSIADVRLRWWVHNLSTEVHYLRSQLRAQQGSSQT